MRCAASHNPPKKVKLKKMEKIQIITLWKSVPMRGAFWIITEEYNITCTIEEKEKRRNKLFLSFKIFPIDKL